VTYRGKEKTFYVRTPTEPEKAMAMNAARLKSRELRDRLEDQKSEEFQLLIEAEKANFSIEEKRYVWLASQLVQKSFELRRRSLEDRDDFYVEPPEGQDDGVIPPTNAEIDKYEQEKRAQDLLRLDALQGQQDILFKELKEQADKIPEADLDNLIQPILIDQKTSAEWNSQYGMQILIRCTFLDIEMTQKAFPEGIGQALRLENTKGGQKVLHELLNAHNGLTIDVDELLN
jgi:hypothetical protein